MILPLASSREMSALHWTWQASDGDGNKYVIVRDGRAGRRWRVLVDVLGTGRGFWYGTFWTLRGATAQAEHYRRNWREILPRPSFQERFGVSSDLVELALERIGADGYARAQAERLG